MAFVMFNEVRDGHENVLAIYDIVIIEEADRPEKMSPYKVENYGQVRDNWGSIEHFNHMTMGDTFNVLSSREAFLESNKWRKRR